jgi:hypothetical protein
MKNKSETPTNLQDINNLLINNSSPTPMLTRSRAQAASSPSNSIITLKNSTRQYGGRIVKPIAVRATLTQSLTSSSTSSSTINNHTNTNTPKINSIKSKLKTLPSDNNDSFSLIAKYFASFPATRLKPFQIPNKTFQTQNLIKNEDLNKINNNDLCNNFKKIININDDLKQETSNRLGQITMETRLTRKFLIKHHNNNHHHYHPYFSSIDSDLSINQHQQQQQQQQQQRVLRKRPSINFIKMKKNLVNLNPSKSPLSSTYRTRSPSPLNSLTPPLITDKLDLLFNNNEANSNSKSSIIDDTDSGYQSLSNKYSNNNINNNNNNKCTSSKCCKLFSFSSAASSCTCDLDLDQIEND